MVYRKLLIRFMELKQRNLGLDFNYFNYHDAKIIDNWCEEHARYVVDEIESNNLKNDIGLYDNCCPFCIYYRNYTTINDRPICNVCAYASNHGMCIKGGSDFVQIDSKTRSTFDWISLWERAKNEMDIEITKKNSLKTWNERGNLDSDGQLYLMLEEYPLNSFFLTVVDKDKNPISHILFIDENGYLRKSINVDSKISQYLKLDNRGRIIEKE